VYQLVYLSTTENRLRISNEDRPWRALTAEKNLNLQLGALKLVERKTIYGKQANGTDAGRTEFPNYMKTQRRRCAGRAVLGSTKLHILSFRGFSQKYPDWPDSKEMN
jgi:hypothetical protein